MSPLSLEHPARVEPTSKDLPKSPERVSWGRIAPFLVMHLACGLVFFVGWSPVAVITAVILYVVRMFGITAFYHRYFSHRSFRASRFVQFCGAVLGASATQRGPLWWAAHHRQHHRHSDLPEDAHSPRIHGFLWAHVGWIAAPENFATDMSQVKDLAKYPELRWLDRFDLVVPLALLLALAGFGALLQAYAPSLGTSALQMAVWGFCISTTALFHVTSAVNSLAHVVGRRDWPTRDQSRNSFLLAVLTLGEGWHNNHHWCPGTVRQGFRWWEVDISFYVLKACSLVGIVSDLRPMPQRARAQERRIR
jgi:stearoyl-CoA desaturase (Delta-9 desaturase)